jgi:signal transduction histidine kinase/CheY-like chemotaxis protein
MMLRAEFETLEVNSPETPFENEEAMKEWIWNNHKDTLMASMSVKCDPSPSIPTSMRLQLLDTIGRVQRKFLQSEGSRVVFGCLLEELLDLVDSEYGFIGEIKYEEDSTMFLQTRAVTDISWNSATRKFYEDNIQDGLKFYNLNSLFGTVMTSKRPVISNDPKTDKRAAGIPDGHPPLNTFLGIPFFDEMGEMTGMVGIANKPGGFSEADIEFLEPFTVTCSTLIQAYMHIRENKKLINTLEEKVQERTQKLQLVNEHLEEANRQVLQASAAQLKHFACMNHEIRTPLNCVIGMSSLLAETQLTPMQTESVKMIVNSGNLLLAVVNDVLDYSKLETGSVDIEVGQSNLQEILQSVVHSIEMKAQPKGLRVKTSYDCLLPEFLTTDGRRLQQILYNLLGNAIKFSEENGVVELSVILGGRTDTSGQAQTFHETSRSGKGHRSCELPAQGTTTEHSTAPIRSPFHRSSQTTVLFEGGSSRCPFTRPLSPTSPEDNGRCAQHENSGKCLEDYEVIRFVVKDYGVGIDETDRDKIFIPYQQARKETERVHGGTGLGLAITAKLLKALGGTISVDSEVDEWTKFTVELPFCDTHVNPSVLSSRLKDTTIILVDKDESNKQAVSSIFKEYSVDLVSCASMREMQTTLSQRRKVGLSHSYVCLTDEDLYEEDTFKVFQTVLPKSSLVTFGPKFAVSSDLHIRSLSQTLPSVLLRSLSQCELKIHQTANPQAAKTDTAAAKTDTAGSCNHSPYSNLRILIAEDNIVNQKVIVRMLTRLGIEKVDVVDNGQKAVDQEAGVSYDVIFMDMQMPVMDGIEACRNIVDRKGKGGHRVPRIIFVTAEISAGIETECMSAGASGFIQKPFTFLRLNTYLQELTESRLDSSSLLGQESIAPNDGIDHMQRPDNTKVEVPSVRMSTPSPETEVPNHLIKRRRHDL